jgi:hypothetical protein
MSRLRLTAVAGVLAALALVTVAHAESSAPALRVHAIFSGGQAKNFHVGQVLFVQGSRGTPKIVKTCWTPAPIARDACITSETAAPAKAGTQRITATLADGTTLSKTFKVRAAAKRVGGRVAVPATITCDTVTLYGGYDDKRHHYNNKIGELHKGDRVALYNHRGPTHLFMWAYANSQAGFGQQSCARVDA